MPPAQLPAGARDRRVPACRRQALDEARPIGDGYFLARIDNHIGQTLTMPDRASEAVRAHDEPLRDPARRPYETAHAGRARATAAVAAMGLERPAIDHRCPPVVP